MSKVELISKILELADYPKGRLWSKSLRQLNKILDHEMGLITTRIYAKKAFAKNI